MEQYNQPSKNFRVKTVEDASKGSLLPVQNRVAQLESTVEQQRREIARLRSQLEVLTATVNQILRR